MFTLIAIVRALRLAFIALRTVASLLILGAGTVRWAQNRRRLAA